VTARPAGGIVVSGFEVGHAGTLAGSKCFLGYPKGWHKCPNPPGQPVPGADGGDGFDSFALSHTPETHFNSFHGGKTKRLRPAVECIAVAFISRLPACYCRPALSYSGHGEDRGRDLRPVGGDRLRVRLDCPCPAVVGHADPGPPGRRPRFVPPSRDRRQRRVGRSRCAIGSRSI